MAGPRIFGLLAAIRDGGYDVVLVQELFIMRLGPFAATGNYEMFHAGVCVCMYVCIAQSVYSCICGFGVRIVYYEARTVCCDWEL